MSPSRGGWLMSQDWSDVLFLHWRVPPETLLPLLPAGLELDTIADEAWVGVIPFRMRIRFRGLGELPWVSRVNERNLRTYVRRGGRSGVFFFRLEATSRLLVAGARLTYRLPYRFSRAEIESSPGAVRYRFGAEFAALARPDGEARPATPGTLEHWLCERYALFAAGRGGRLARGDIRHAPWPLRAARVEIERCTV